MLNKGGGGVDEKLAAFEEGREFLDQDPNCFLSIHFCIALSGKLGFSFNTTITVKAYTANTCSSVIFKSGKIATGTVSSLL